MRWESDALMLFTREGWYPSIACNAGKNPGSRLATVPLRGVAGVRR